MTASRFSFAPLGDPGSVKIKVFRRTPATGRDIMATVRLIRYSNGAERSGIGRLTRSNGQRSRKHAMPVRRLDHVSSLRKRS
jgi:hypothetical protein